MSLHVRYIYRLIMNDKCNAEYLCALCVYIYSNWKKKEMAQSLHIGLFLNPLLTYLLVSVPFVLTLRYNYIYIDIFKTQTCRTIVESWDNQRGSVIQDFSFPILEPRKKKHGVPYKIHEINHVSRCPWDLSYAHRIHGNGRFTYMNSWFFMVN